ncbi:MAG: cobalt ECF transporter T component CbiQ [Prochlorothrix sp.]
MAIAFHAKIYVRGTSPIHRWAVRAKVLSLLVLIFAIALIQHLVLIPWILAAVLLLYSCSQLPLAYLLRRLPYPGLFIVAMVGLLPWVSGETILWQWQGLSLRLEGLQSALLVMGRFLAIVTTSFILLGTTPFLDLVQALRSWGLPPLLADMTLLTYRYLYDIANQLATMQQAMQLRGYGLHREGIRRQGLRRQWEWLVSLFGSLLLRSYEQSQRVYHAMRLRGYGQLTPTPPQRSSRSPLAQQSEHLITQVATSLTLTMATGLVIAEWILTYP